MLNAQKKLMLATFISFLEDGSYKDDHFFDQMFQSGIVYLTDIF